MRIIKDLLLVAATIFVPACVTYHGVAKVGDQVYLLTGSESFFIFGKSWVKRCVEQEGKFYCEEVRVISPPGHPIATQQNMGTPATPDPLEEEPPEVQPEAHTPPPIPPYPLPEVITCQNAAALLCICRSDNMTVHAMVCQRARQAVSDYSNNETACLNLVRPMFQYARCLPP